MLVFYVAATLILVAMGCDEIRSPGTHHSTNTPEKVKYCIDCRQHFKDECIIGQSGYSCVNRLKPSGYKPLHRLRDAPIKTTNLSVCVPDEITISDMEFKICCVWSPLLGCQPLVETRIPIRCQTCIEAEKIYKDLNGCPCMKRIKFIHPENGIGKLDSTIVPFLVIFYILNAL
nr:uncharacterized protein LOC122321593 [Drosophila bipectinata]